MAKGPTEIKNIEGQHLPFNSNPSANDASVKPTVSNSIANAINTSGLSITEIAERTGFTYQSVWNWSKGGKFPSLNAMGRLARALDIPLTQFIDPVDNHNPIEREISFKRIKSVLELTKGTNQNLVLALYLSLDMNGVVPNERIEELKEIFGSDIELATERWFLKSELGLVPLIPITN